MIELFQSDNELISYLISSNFQTIASLIGIITLLIRFYSKANRSYREEVEAHKETLKQTIKLQTELLYKLTKVSDLESKLSVSIDRTLDLIEKHGLSNESCESLKDISDKLTVLTNKILKDAS